MEVNEEIKGEDEEEEIRRVIKNAKNIVRSARSIVTQQPNLGANIPSRNIIYIRKIPNVGQPHIGRPSLGEVRHKMIEQDIANGKQHTLE